MKIVKKITDKYRILNFGATYVKKEMNGHLTHNLERRKIAIQNGFKSDIDLVISVQYELIDIGYIYSEEVMLLYNRDFNFYIVVQPREVEKI